MEGHDKQIEAQFREACARGDASRIQALASPERLAKLGDAARLSLLHAALQDASAQGLLALRPMLTPVILNPPEMSLFRQALLYASDQEMLIFGADKRKIKKDARLLELFKALGSLGACVANETGPNSALSLCLERGADLAPALVACGAIPTMDDLGTAIALGNFRCFAIFLPMINPAPERLDKLAEAISLLAAGAHITPEARAEFNGSIEAFKEQRTLSDLLPIATGAASALRI